MEGIDMRWPHLPHLTGCIKPPELSSLSLARWRGLRPKPCPLAVTAFVLSARAPGAFTLSFFVV